MRALVLFSALLVAVSAGHHASSRAYSSGGYGHGYGYSLPSGHAHFSFGPPSHTKTHHHTTHHHKPVVKYVPKPQVKIVEVPKVVVKEVPKYVVKEVPKIIIKEVPKTIIKEVEVPQVVVKEVPVLQRVHVAAPVTYTPTVRVVSAHQPVAPVAVRQVTPVAVSAAPLSVAPAYTHAASVSSQYHAQDELGQYQYGYTNGVSSKQELKTADGIVRGGFSYVDANGQTQVASYYSDALGFHVARTDLPVAPVAPASLAVAPVTVTVAETPEVAAARVEHLRAHADALSGAEQSARRKRSLHYSLPLGFSARLSPLGRFAYATPAPAYAYTTPAHFYSSLPTVAHAPASVATSYAYGTPVAAAYAAPYAYAAPAAVSSQYHAQNELGQYNYGYQGGPSAKQEVKTADGVVRGSYTYLDANGQLQTATYYSDALGFHVARTDLPVAPVHKAATPVDTGVAPQPVRDTAEVAAAKAQHAQAHAEALAAADAE